MKRHWETYGSEPAEAIVAIDFESYYDDEISLRKMSAWKYTRHPRVDPYLLSVVGDGFEWVGHPKDFRNWDFLTGKVVVAHNMAFDLLFFERLREEGVVPESCRPARFACTADCTAYFRSTRSLQAAAKNFFGADISKQVRTDAKGKTYDEMRNSDSWSLMLKYGLDDSRWCRRIAVEKFPEWPAAEQRLSELNRMAAHAGIHIDRDELDRGIAELETALFNYGKAIPWYPEETALSMKAIRAQGRKDGILVPASLSKSDEAGEAFYQDYGDRFPWVRAIRHFRSTNILLAKLKTMEANLRGDGTMPYTSTYFGAHSGRLTAGVKKESSADDVGGAFNLYNLPKFEMQGVNLRHLLIPPPGHKFLIADYAQVEARVVLWVAGDVPTLGRIRSGYNVYEAAAVNILGREDTKGLKKKEPKTYSFVKATVLGANYNMGGPRFRVSAPVLTGGEYRPDEAEAAEAIAKYRAANPLIVSQWHYHQSMLMSSAANRDATHSVRLPSGRKLVYFDPQYVLVEDDFGRPARRELMAAQVLSDSPRRIYGGKIFENVAQAIARDILRDGWIALIDAGYAVNWTVYDEFVVPVPDKGCGNSGCRWCHPENFDKNGGYVGPAPQVPMSESCEFDVAAKDIHRLATQSSPWAEGLPLDMEIELASHYKK